MKWFKICADGAGAEVAPYKGRRPAEQPMPPNSHMYDTPTHTHTHRHKQTHTWLTADMSRSVEWVAMERVVYFGFM